ncbi:peptidoglycan-binding domain-containing protein [Streptomyces sp. NPDC050856]|uniref:peptidoglycan-binding domain-containing protein n=1 Tax=Streptomyces sp. NPDC050856 TaxID=3154939 RepID=UPI0033FC27B5
MSRPSGGAAPAPSRPAGGPAPSPSAPRPPSTEPAAATPETLSRGDRGQEVTELQHRLRQAGLYDGPAHGRYDKAVEEAVYRYQRARDLQEDGWGVYGPQTRAALEGETAGG